MSVSGMIASAAFPEYSRRRIISRMPPLFRIVSTNMAGRVIDDTKHATSVQSPRRGAHIDDEEKREGLRLEEMLRRAERACLRESSEDEVRSESRALMPPTSWMALWLLSARAQPQHDTISLPVTHRLQRRREEKRTVGGEVGESPRGVGANGVLWRREAPDQLQDQHAPADGLLVLLCQ